MIWRGRLNREDVKASASEVVLAQGLGEGCVINEGTAADIDQVGIRFHQGKSLSIDEVPVFISERTVQRDDVRGGKEVFVWDPGNGISRF